MFEDEFDFAVVQDEPMDAYSVRLTAWHARQALIIGKRKRSRGIRIAIEFYIKNHLNSDDESEKED